MLTFLLIVAAELIVLFRLLLPEMVAFGERRYNAHYGIKRRSRLDPMQQITGDIANTNSLQSTPFHEGVNTDA